MKEGDIMYKIDIDDINFKILLIATGDISEIEFKDIIKTITEILDENKDLKYKIFISMKDFKFYYWQLPYLMKMNRLILLDNVSKMSIVVDRELARTYSIRLGKNNNKKQGFFLTEEEAKEFLDND